jgi:hypothetical protein
MLKTLLLLLICVLFCVFPFQLISFRPFGLQGSRIHTFVLEMSSKSTASTAPTTTPLTANGKRIEAIPGSSMMEACQKLNLKVPTVN